MGRVAVRAAIQEYFDDAGLPFVGTVFAARPVIVSEAEYESTMMGEVVVSEGGSSAILVVNLPTNTRRREADTGRGAVNDRTTHDAAVELFFKSNSGDGVTAQTDYDEIVDAIVSAIRADGTLGNSQVIWSAGEYGGIHHVQGQPYTSADGLTILISGVITFQCMEWVAGAV